MNKLLGREATVVIMPIILALIYFGEVSHADVGFYDDDIGMESVVITSARRSTSNPGKVKVVSKYNKLPLYFEVNGGQTDAQTKFVSRGRGYTLFLTQNEAVLTLQNLRIERKTQGAIEIPAELPHFMHSQIATVRMQLIGANQNSAVEGLDTLPGNRRFR